MTGAGVAAILALVVPGRSQGLVVLLAALLATGAVMMRSSAQDSLNTLLGVAAIGGGVAAIGGGVATIGGGVAGIGGGVAAIGLGVAAIGYGVAAIGGRDTLG